jgi:hypothetical protein
MNNQLDFVRAISPNIKENHKYLKPKDRVLMAYDTFNEGKPYGCYYNVKECADSFECSLSAIQTCIRFGRLKSWRYKIEWVKLDE